MGRCGRLVGVGVHSLGKRYGNSFRRPINSKVITDVPSEALG